MNSTTPRRALVSVSDKTGLAAFAGGLTELGFEIISTGGTRRHLEESGIPVIDISAYTEFPEIMDGRVKTLHPRVHGAILGRPGLASDAEAMREHGIVPFELVVCNLYPFEETIAKPNVAFTEAIEQIDIGGPSMVRSAAKNHSCVAIVSDPSDYDEVLARLRAGSVDEEFRRYLAAAAFRMTAIYDNAIAAWMLSQTSPTGTDSGDRDFPELLQLSFQRKSSLRYGENSHQQAAFYVEEKPSAGSLATAEQLNGKELSYNNLLDLDSARAITAEFPQPAAVVIKHNNPCGCAVHERLSEAFEKAYEGDPVSAFGSIIGFNRPVDAATAEGLCEPGRFIEAIIAPGFDDDAFKLLTTKPKWKSNVRLMRCEFPGHTIPMKDYRRVSGGLLVQESDLGADPESEWQVVTGREPSDAEWRDLKFAWAVCRFVKSNAIVFAADEAIVGVGAGQMSRLDSASIAATKAGERSRGGVVASDAFFPFRDGIDQAAEAGIRAAIQPGGSRNDKEVIAACDEHGMAMVFTGRRHFRH